MQHVTNYRQQPTGYKPQTAGDRRATSLQVIVYKLQAYSTGDSLATGYRLQVTGYRLTATGYRLSL